MAGVGGEKMKRGAWDFTIPFKGKLSIIRIPVTKPYLLKALYLEMIPDWGPDFDTWMGLWGNTPCPNYSTRDRDMNIGTRGDPKPKCKREELVEASKRQK